MITLIYPVCAPGGISRMYHTPPTPVFINRQCQPSRASGTRGGCIRLGSTQSLQHLQSRTQHQGNTSGRELRHTTAAQAKSPGGGPVFCPRQPLPCKRLMVENVSRRPSVTQAANVAAVLTKVLAVAVMCSTPTSVEVHIAPRSRRNRSCSFVCAQTPVEHVPRRSFPPPPKKTNASEKQHFHHGRASMLTLEHLLEAKSLA